MASNISRRRDTSHRCVVDAGCWADDAFCLDGSPDRPSPRRRLVAARIAPTVDLDYVRLSRKNVVDRPACPPPDRVAGAIDVDEPPVESPPPPPGPLEDPGDVSPSPLDIWLETRGLGAWAGPIRSLGARKVTDLLLLADDDLDEVGMPLDLRANIRVVQG